MDEQREKVVWATGLALRVVAQLLLHPERSDEAIAAEVGLSSETVTAIRSELAKVE